MSEASFDTWMRKLDARVARTTGVSVHDLPDMAFYDWFDSGITPAQAAQLVFDEVL